MKRALIGSRERGMSYWPFVVTLILLFVAVYLWYEAEQGLDSWKDKAQAAAEGASKAKEERTNIQLAFQNASDVVGYLNPDVRRTDPEKVSAAISSLQASLREKLSIEFETSKYDATGQGGEIEEIGQGKVRVNYLKSADMGSAKTLEEILPSFVAAAERMQHDIKRAFEAQAAEVTAKGSLQTQHASALTAKDERAGELQAQIGNLNANLDEQGRELRGTIDSLTRQLTAAQEQLQAVREENEATVADLSNKVNQANGEVVRLNNREIPFIAEGPDGSVIASNSEVTIIDRGRDHLLMPGTVFEVFGREKGGKLYHKGVIKVTVSEDSTARARQVDLKNASDPIVKGDVIQSATYSPNRELHFYLLGEFDKIGRSDLAARLEGQGAVVDSNVMTTTHYLVLGMPGPGGDDLKSTEAYREAQRYGIKVMTETQLLSFIR